MPVVAGFQTALDLPDPSEVLLEQHLGVPVGLVDWPGGLAQELNDHALKVHGFEGD